MTNINNIMPGDRVRAYDSSLYINDRETPFGIVYKPATVVCRYGFVSKLNGLRYPDCCDVIFDHKPDTISKGHFTYLIYPF